MEENKFIRLSSDVSLRMVDILFEDSASADGFMLWMRQKGEELFREYCDAGIHPNAPRKMGKFEYNNNMKVIEETDEEMPKIGVKMIKKKSLAQKFLEMNTPSSKSE